MEPLQRKPRIVSITPPPVQPPAQQPQPPSPPTTDNPLAKAMEEEALRDLRPSNPQPAAPRIISPLPPAPAIGPFKESSEAEVRRKIEEDQARRQSSLSSRLKNFFSGLFKKKNTRGTH